MATENDTTRLIRQLGLGTLDGYTLRSSLGQGGQGTACLYSDPDGQLVVAKFLLQGDNESITRLEREAQTLLTLNEYTGEKTVVGGVTKAKKVQNLPIHYFFMEHAEGTTLSRIIETKPPPWPWRDALEMVWRVAFALQQPHLRGYVHRDLHPGNILVRDSYRFAREPGEARSGIRLLDFGTQTNVYPFLITNPALSPNTFRPVGSVTHLSPEGLTNPSGVKLETDIWAVGVMAFRLLVGDLPFFEPTLQILIERVCKDPYKEPDRFENASPAEEVMLRGLLSSLLCKLPSKRPGVGLTCRMIEDALLTRLADEVQDREFFAKYFDANGDLWMCPGCKKTVSPDGSRCTSCGAMWEGYDWIPILYDRRTETDDAPEAD